MNFIRGSVFSSIGLPISQSTHQVIDAGLLGAPRQRIKIVLI